MYSHWCCYIIVHNNVLSLVLIYNNTHQSMYSHLCCYIIVHNNVLSLVLIYISTIHQCTLIGVNFFHATFPHEYVYNVFFLLLLQYWINSDIYDVIITYQVVAHAINLQVKYGGSLLIVHMLYLSVMAKDLVIFLYAS